MGDPAKTGPVASLTGTGLRLVTEQCAQKLRARGVKISPEEIEAGGDTLIAIAQRLAETAPPAGPTRITTLLTSVLVALVLVAGSGVVLRFRDLAERDEEHTAALTAQALSLREATQALGEERARLALERERAKDERDELRKEIEINRADIDLVIAAQNVRLDAIGKKTGADQLPEWGQVPRGLELRHYEAQARLKKREQNP